MSVNALILRYITISGMIALDLLINLMTRPQPKRILAENPSRGGVFDGLLWKHHHENWRFHPWRGCNLGHGVTSMSTMAISSLVAITAILLRNWTMVNFKLMRMDE